MEFWIEHFSSAISYITVSVPLYLMIRFLTVFLLKEKINLKKELLMLIFVMYIVSLFSQTIFISLPSNINNIFPLDLRGRINTDTFQVFFDSIRNMKTGNYQYFVINVLGNLIAFVPLGIFIPLIFPSRKVFSVVMIGFCTSLLIEIIQLTVIRATDVDDIMLNTLGTLLGYLIYRFVFKKKHI